MSTTRTPSVWLLQEPRGRGAEINLSDVAQFGTVRPVLSASSNPGQAPGQALRTLFSTFRSQYANGDRILFAPGDPVLPLLAGLALHAVGATRDELQWMRWERAAYTEEDQRRLAEGIPVKRRGFYMPTFIDARPLFGFENRE